MANQEYESNINDLKIEIIEEPEQIYKNLHYGINLPVTEDLKIYILNEIRALNIKSLLLKNDQGSVIGHTILYQFDGIQYFGFFNVNNGIQIHIELLISEIIQEAKRNECNSIRGPMNPPPEIYGWGFSEKGCDSSIFATAPFNKDDIKFIDAFQNKGFEFWHRIVHYTLPYAKFSRKSAWKISNADFSHPENWLKECFELQMREFPESAQITPNREAVAEDYMKFIAQFGKEDHVQYIRDPENGGKMVGLMYVTPNCFDLDENGKTKAVLVNGAAIDKEYQNNHMVMELLGSISEAVAKEGINSGETIIEENNIRSRKGAEKAGGRLNRSHVVLELKLN